MFTEAEVVEAEKLVEALRVPLRTSGARRVYATFERGKTRPEAVVHSAFIGARVVTTIAEALAHAQASEKARKAGVLPQEMRVGLA